MSGSGYNRFLLIFALAFCYLLPGYLSDSVDRNVKTFIFRVHADSKPSVFPTHHHWYTSSFVNEESILHTYETVFHGFSASLSPDVAAAIGEHSSVLAVFEDRCRQLHTTRSPQFIGLRNEHGLWSQSDYGSDVIIGVFDTGIWPERPSFSDHNLGPVPDRWRGVCQTGEKFTTANCNRKLIGARYFDQGSRARVTNMTGIEYRSPRDADGHGTHTASTAAGMHVFNASMFGYAAGIAKGVAPKSRLSVYKVCWNGMGCMDSDILSAFDNAIRDGVDVISISIGGGDGISSPYYLDPIAIGSYAAAAKGIFVATSCGNDGPNQMTVTNVSPWLTTVGASTIDRTFPAEIVLGSGYKIHGVSLYSGKGLDRKMYPLVYPGNVDGPSASLCMDNSLSPVSVGKKIVICDRGSNARVAKGYVVKEAGGVGMILANGVTTGEGLVADAHVLPACALGAMEASRLKKYAAQPNATATISFQGTVTGLKPAPVVASFSSRGPNGLDPSILKPDIIAPGVNILAAWTDAVGPSGLRSDVRRSSFSILSGTSMACPHVAGAAALLKSSHPDWTPAMIRSAMMTTATVLDNRAMPLTDEASAGSPTPLDYGAGHLNLGLALDPGLTYDISPDDYLTFLCSSGYDSKTVQVLSHSPFVCPAKKPSPENLNYPSMVAIFSGSSGKGLNRKTFIRTATNVGDAHANYTAKVEAPLGMVVAVKPNKLEFSPAARMKRFVVTVSTGRGIRFNNGYAFGSLIWTDQKHVVRSPILVTQGDTV